MDPAFVLALGRLAAHTALALWKPSRV